jgi:hypothetical protein
MGGKFGIKSLRRCTTTLRVRDNSQALKKGRKPVKVPAGTVVPPLPLPPPPPPPPAAAAAAAAAAAPPAAADEEAPPPAAAAAPPTPNKSKG